MYVPDLQRAVASLPKQTRKGSKFQQYAGLETRQIAEIMDISKSTVKDHVQRARRALPLLFDQQNEVKLPV